MFIASEFGLKVEYVMLLTANSGLQLGRLSPGFLQRIRQDVNIRCISSHAPPDRQEGRCREAGEGGIVRSVQVVLNIGMLLADSFVCDS